jgi:hypothetical protein
MQRRRAGKVCSIWQVFSASAQNAIVLKGWMERNSRPKTKVYKLINFN